MQFIISNHRIIFNIFHPVQKSLGIHAFLTSHLQLVNLQPAVVAGYIEVLAIGTQRPYPNASILGSLGGAEYLEYRVAAIGIAEGGPGARIR